MTSFDRPRRLPRRALLRGAGVALALPWLESWARPARAQAARMPQRFLAMFLPNGAPELWKPPMTGEGGAWQLSSVLEPLSVVKSQLAVISGLENGSVFNLDGDSSVEPSHGKLPGAWLTCTDAGAVRTQLGVADVNGISLDQVMAAHQLFADKTPLPSLQVGLSTCESYCDGEECSLSRSVSWNTQTTPMYKQVDPTLVFNALVGGWSPGGGDATALKDSRQSVLDAVLESSAAVRKGLSAQDKLRMDQFLESVRSVEKKIAAGAFNACATTPQAPIFPAVTSTSYKENQPGIYDKGEHFDVMNELVALAFQCDRTRIISYMLEDERSEFRYTHVARRVFGATTSTLGTGTCDEWHALQHSAPDFLASIVHWHMGKLAALCQRLADMEEGDGTNVLQNSVIYLGASMHGVNHSAANLPVLTIGGGGGALKLDQHLDLTKRPLRDFYFTLMNGVYGLNAASFGTNRTGAPCALIEQLLA